MKRLFYCTLLCLSSLLFITSCSSDGDLAYNNNVTEANKYIRRSTEVQKELTQLIAEDVSADEFGDKVSQIFESEIPGLSDISAKASEVVSRMEKENLDKFEDFTSFISSLNLILQSSALDKSSDEYRKLEALVFYQDLVHSVVENNKPETMSKAWCRFCYRIPPYRNPVCGAWFRC